MANKDPHNFVLGSHPDVKRKVERQHEGDGEEVENEACKRNNAEKTFGDGDKPVEEASHEQNEEVPGQSLNILLDAGYGLPTEARPRQEKLLAIAKQTINFLSFQALQESKINNMHPCRVTIVGCPQDMQEALQQRLDNLWQNQRPQAASISSVNPLPFHVQFYKPSDVETGEQDLFHGDEDSIWKNAVYLSPDAEEILDPTQPPPGKVVVGLLIDRRVQLNRSLNRAAQLGLTARRWPLELVDIYTTDTIHSNEPLNIDTLLEMVQQWQWNCDEARRSGEEVDGSTYQRALVDATVQALQRHADRHPARPRHRSVENY